MNCRQYDKMHFVKPLVITAVRGFMMAMLLYPKPATQISFTSQYGGATVKGTVGSSVQFNWSFTGDVDSVDWGLTLAADSNLFDNNQRLYSLPKTGSIPVTPPPAYNGRVSGSRSGGNAIFTLSKLETGDARFYGCRINPTDPNDDTEWDNVKLVVEGPPKITDTSANPTVNEGDDVKLNCTADGNPSPSISWTRLSDNSVVTMPLTRIRRQGEGGYRCTANNGIGNPVSGDVFITVRYQAAITSAKTSVTQSWIGQTVRLECVADGVPTPTITWKTPDGSEIKKDRTTHNIVDVLMEKDQDFGNYTCVAENGVGVMTTSTIQVNQIKAPGSPSITVEIEATSLTITWTALDYDGGSPITGYQAVILQRGKVIENKTLGAAVRVYSFVSLNRSTNYTLRVSARNKVFEGDASELKVKTKYEGPPFAVEMIDLPAETKKTDVTLTWNESQNNGAPITKYTVYQQNGADGLPRDWIKIKEKTNLSDRKFVVQKLEKDKVYEFAVTATNKHGESLIAEKSMTKIKVLGDVPEPVVITEALYEDGKITLKWQKPEENGAAIILYSKYQRIAGEEQWTNRENIIDTSKRSHVFNVKKGEKYEFVMTATNKYGESEKTNVQEVEVLAATTKPPENQRGSCGIAHAAYISAIILLVIVIVCLLVLVWRMRRRPCLRCGNLIAMNPVATQEKEDTQRSNGERVNEPPTYATPAVSTVGDYMPLHPIGRSWEISRELVNVIKVIGKGAFSQVAQATVRDMRGRRENIIVAVKMLKEDAPDSDRKDLLSELELMKKLKPHPHVIKLIGCVTQNDPLLVLIEYVPFGDLLGYLRKSRGLNDTYYKDPDIKPQTDLTAEQLLRFAWQVADGMCYLSSKKIIHRDLAARNILVGEREVCKVTDFGMARNANQDDIYTRKSRGRLPVKWTAYEALLYGTYTTQSDVWSYGILLYEILTVGGSPYPNINARHIARKIQEGYRMPKPRHVDSKLFEIMLKCWEENPTDRPTFGEVRKTMKDMEKKHKTYVNLNEYDNRMYVNLSDLTAE